MILSGSCGFMNSDLEYCLIWYLLTWIHDLQRYDIVNGVVEVESNKVESPDENDKANEGL